MQAYYTQTIDADDLHLAQLNQMNFENQQRTSLRTLSATILNPLSTEGGKLALHPDLIAVALRARALSGVPFVFIRGLRTPQEQMEYIIKGWSQLRNSPHLHGLALDVAPVVGGRVVEGENYRDFYWQIADAFERAGRELGIPVGWGGHWTRFTDLSHFQLPKNYDGQKYTRAETDGYIARAMNTVAINLASSY